MSVSTIEYSIDVINVKHGIICEVGEVGDISVDTRWNKFKLDLLEKINEQNKNLEFFETNIHEFNSRQDEDFVYKLTFNLSIGNNISDRGIPDTLCATFTAAKQGGLTEEDADNAYKNSKLVENCIKDLIKNYSHLR